MTHRPLNHPQVINPQALLKKLCVGKDRAVHGDEECYNLMVRATPHTVDHDPCIKSQFTHTQLTLRRDVVQIWSRPPSKKGHRNFGS